MTDFISDFITFIVNNGIMPRSTKDVVPSDHFKRLASQSDKGGKRSISYWLKIEHDFAYGYAHDFRTGISKSFKSYNQDSSLSRADIARIKALLKARQADQDAIIAARQAKTAQRAKKLWDGAKIGGESPYAEKKGIAAISARTIGDDLLISLNDPKSGEIVSYQRIRPDGRKKFPFGGKKKGCCHVIGQIDPTKPFVMCEGYATGCTLHEATKMPVVVAFDAGNMLPVAQALRGIYRTTPIIVAADNDQSQTGQKAADGVKAKVQNVTIVTPQTIGADFNDIGLEATKAAFEGGGEMLSSFDGLQPSKSSQSPAVSISDDWIQNLITDGKNRVVATSTQNAILHLLHHPDFVGVFAYDEFKQSCILRKCPPWQEIDDFDVVELSDIHITQTSATLERYGLACGIEKCSKAIDVVAAENMFHSAREYFSGLKWDGVKRLENFCVDYLGTTDENPEYLAFVFKKWMTAAVKRVMEPGCKFDHVLILESQQQGIYKSQLLKTLATFSGECYHTDSVSIADLENKDTAMKMQGKLIIELAELSGFSKKEDSQIKNWMTQTKDELRIPFARKIVVYPRQFVFAATTNNYDYLRDPTGNRRYWPVTVGKIIDIDAVKKIKDQMWAEAFEHYQNGLYLGPTEEENALAEIERSKRLQSDAWEDMVLGIVNGIGLDEFKTSDILAKMDLKTNDKNERAIRRISTVLKMNGYVNDPKWDKRLNKAVRVWTKP